jgi:hypothetical protein
MIVTGKTIGLLAGRGQRQDSWGGDQVVGFQAIRTR